MYVSMSAGGQRVICWCRDCRDGVETKSDDLRALFAKSPLARSGADYTACVTSITGLGSES